MRLLTASSLALCLLANATGLAAQGTSKSRDRGHPDPAKLSVTADRLVKRFMKEKHVPGLVPAVVRGGKVVVEIFIINLQGKALGTHALANELLREICGLRLPEGMPAPGG